VCYNDFNEVADSNYQIGEIMRYEFQVIKTVAIDSTHLNVGDEEQAREFLANGWGIETGEVETRLVHVGHGLSN
jgi:hypothetical protein